ncbi:hypothetical protein [Phenylobacterium sp.]|uniref:hypothetical protein n=1 Tax=Phenylobacterium sp. TaxID=1871053 RepID=UPI0035B4E2EA
MKDSTAPGRSETVAARFRREIEHAEAGGLERASMTLRLTLTDASRLRRDPGLAVADISFEDGVMRYLGVAIAQGGVADSVLDLGDGADAPDA